MSSTISLRPANSSEHDGLIYARHLDVAAEGFFRLMLGPQSEQIVASAFAEPGHDLSYQNVTFAQQDNVVVGMASGYTAEAHRRSSLETLKRAAGPSNLRMRIVLVLFSPMMRIIDSIADNDFYLQAIAIDEELRGSGVGTVLMDSIEQQARASGSTRLALDVSANNQNARSFYERRGMSIESQWPKRLNIPSLRFYRMIKTLG